MFLSLCYLITNQDLGMLFFFFHFKLSVSDILFLRKILLLCLLSNFVLYFINDSILKSLLWKFTKYINISFRVHYNAYNMLSDISKQILAFLHYIYISIYLYISVERYLAFILKYSHIYSLLSHYIAMPSYPA